MKIKTYYYQSISQWIKKYDIPSKMARLISLSEEENLVIFLLNELFILFFIMPAWYPSASDAEQCRENGKNKQKSFIENIVGKNLEREDKSIFIFVVN